MELGGVVGCHGHVRMGRAGEQSFDLGSEVMWNRASRVGERQEGGYLLVFWWAHRGCGVPAPCYATGHLSRWLWRYEVAVA